MSRNPALLGDGAAGGDGLARAMNLSQSIKPVLVARAMFGFVLMLVTIYDKIGEGTHTRAIVPWDRFKQGVAAKASKVKR